MTYYLDEKNALNKLAIKHSTQFEYVGIFHCLETCIFLRQHEAITAFNAAPDQFVYLINSILEACNKKIIICLDQDPIDPTPYVEILSANFDNSDWFILTCDFSKPPTANTAPWPYFLISQQLEKNLQLGKVKQHRIGFLCGVPRLHRLQVWAAVKDYIQKEDVVVVNAFSYDYCSYSFTPEILDLLNSCPLPWSNYSTYIDQDQTLTCASGPTRNDHPAFNSFCIINAETCDDTGPLFFSEKTWKSYISGCLTVNYGPLQAPAWLADHGVEIWTNDKICSNQQKIPIIRDLFRSSTVEELYYQHLSAIEYNQHLIDSRAFLRRVIESSMSALCNWVENR